MKHKIGLLYTWFVRIVLYIFPDIPLIMRLRGFLYSFALAECGRNFQITQNAILRSTDTIYIGNDVYIANNCVILGGGEIHIADEVLIGPNTVVASRNHMIKKNSFRFGESKGGSIRIGKGSWVAANCTLVANSALPDGSLLAANSVLTKKHVIMNALYAGAPAQFVKRFKHDK